LTAGCDAEESAPSVDAGAVDAGTEAACSGYRPNCRVPMACGDLGLVPGFASDSHLWQGKLPVRESVSAGIRLISRGIFRRGLTTGEFELVNKELDPNACGACIWLGYRSDPTDEDSPIEYSWVTGGTLNITDLSGRMTGVLSDARFVHIVATDDPTPAADGCATFIERLEFDEPMIFTDG
jgi:hypothetical protein